MGLAGALPAGVGAGCGGHVEGWLVNAHCPAVLATGSNGALLCVDELGAAVEWQPLPIVDYSAVGAPFSAGFILVASFWALGHGVSLVIDLVRR